jgi:hypothetical protein
LALWAVVRGESLLPPVPQPCEDQACRYRVPIPVEEQQTPREYLREIRHLLHTVGEAHRVPVENPT